MKYPKRTETHVTEADSWRLLQSLAPAEWIIREVSERDYGIDAYIELVSKDGNITGKLISVQLKGERNLEWKPSDGESRVARSPSVRTTTATYWLGIPVPVFLFVADLTAENVYFVSVQECIRRKYDKLESQKSITFKLSDRLDVKSERGLAQLHWFYNREINHDQLVFHLTNLINQVEMFGEFIHTNQNRDIFLEVETARHLQFRVLYKTCKMASVYLYQEWAVESLNELYERDYEMWQDNYCLLHEKTLDNALQKIEKLFPALVRKAIELVTVIQASYWRKENPVFFSLCSSGELNWILKKFEVDAGR